MRSARPLEYHAVPSHTAAQSDHRALAARSPVDGESFATYVEKIPLPTLRQGNIVIMDNLGSYRGKVVR